MIRYIFSFTHSFRLVNNPLIKFIHIYTHSSTIQVKITELSSCFFFIYKVYLVCSSNHFHFFRYISSLSLTFFHWWFFIFTSEMQHSFLSDFVDVVWTQLKHHGTVEFIVIMFGKTMYSFYKLMECFFKIIMFTFLQNCQPKTADNNLY